MASPKGEPNPCRKPNESGPANPLDADHWEARVVQALRVDLVYHFRFDDVFVFTLFTLLSVLPSRPALFSHFQPLFSAPFGAIGTLLELGSSGPTLTGTGELANVYHHEMARKRQRQLVGHLASRTLDLRT